MEKQASDLPPCNCIEAGYCASTNRQVDDHQLMLCQTNAGGYRETWLAMMAGTYDPFRQSAPISITAKQGDCVHRVDQLRTEQCPTCCGSVKIKVFACSARGECTLSKIVGNIPCCANCAQFKPESGGQASPVIP